MKIKILTTYTVIVGLATICLHGQIPRKKEDLNTGNERARPELAVDEELLLIAASNAEGAAMAIISNAKKHGTFDPRLFSMPAIDQQIVVRVGLYVIAIGEFCQASKKWERFLETTDLELGDIFIPPQICFPEEYHKNIDALALTPAGAPVPKPEFRRLGELIEETRRRLRERQKGLDNKTLQTPQK
jgi:hypothetical protein